MELGSSTSRLNATLQFHKRLASAAQVFDCEVQVRPQQVAGFVDGLVLSLCALNDHSITGLVRCLQEANFLLTFQLFAQVRR